MTKATTTGGGARIGAVLDGRCAACGFDPAAWSDGEALDALAAMPDRWRATIVNAADAAVSRRVQADRWSIAEYVDHVRETMFAMRFLLDVAVDEPGSDLGDPGDPPFEANTRRIDLAATLVRFGAEVQLLCRRLREVPSAQWTSTVVIRSRPVDVRWILLNSVHETSHHLADIEELATIAGRQGCG